MPKWKQFQNLVADVQRALAPEAHVTQNEKVRGKITGVLRDVEGFFARSTLSQAYDYLSAQGCPGWPPRRTSISASDRAGTAREVIIGCLFPVAPCMSGEHRLGADAPDALCDDGGAARGLPTVTQTPTPE